MTSFEGFVLGTVSNTLGNLMADAVKKYFGHRSDPIPNLEFSINNDLVASKSYTRAFCEIMDALKDDKVNTIGVWGIGGVGKTTLATVVGNTVKALNLFDQVIMVVVSQTPDVGKIRQKIADFINFKFQETREVKAGELWDRLEKEEKVLIILDDMWKILNLEEIGVPLRRNGKGCKIILTTRHKPICESMARQVKVPLGVLDMARYITVPLGVLGEDEAWTLFKKKASLDEDTADVEIINVAKKVAKKCKGLPVAVVTLASALKGASAIEEWETALNKLENNRLMEIGDIEKDEENAYMCLQTSYEYLKDTTKKLFLLCAVYPEDCSIDPEELVRCAWGLNIYRNATSIQEVRGDVLAAIEKLKDSCLLLEDIQDRSERPSTWDQYTRNMHKTSYIKMHDVVRDVAQWIASKEDNGLVTNIGVGPKNEIDKQKLEILVRDNYDDSETPIDDFKGMPRLKVLSLSAARRNGNVFSLNALEPLTDLGVLQLVGYKRLEGISALAKLTKIEILCLYGSSFEESVEELGELANLRVLDLRQCNFLLGFPPNLIRRLVKTEELYLYGSNISTAILPELHSLSKLASLYLQAPSLHFPQDFLFPRLQRYQISINSSSLLPKRPHISSRFLMISKGGLNVISELLQNVEFLKVSEIDKKYFRVTTSGKVALAVKILKNLKLVSIERCENLQVIFETEKTENHALLLSKLKALSLQWLPNLGYIWKMPTQHVRLHSLEAVHLRQCGKLKSVFSFSLAQCLIRLQLLEIGICAELKQIVEEELKGDEQKTSANRNPNKSLCLPKLKTLKIWYCERLEYIFPNFMASQGLPQLQKLSMKDLPQLKQICRPAMQREENSILLSQPQELLPSLTELKLRDCPELIDALVIPKEAKLEFPKGFLQNLKKLTVQRCDELQELFKIDCSWEENRAQPLSNLDHYFSLRSLKVVNISECGKLKSLFSPSLIQSLLQLEELQIEDCAELKTLFAELESVGETESNSHLHPLCLPRLTTLNITRCERLGYVLPVTLAQGLPQLEQLQIKDCAELKTFFAELESVGETESNSHLHPLWLKSEKQVVMFSKLESLKLESLPNLVSFNSVGYHLIFSSLGSLEIQDCPQMITSFTMDSISRVHARTKAVKAPQLDGTTPSTTDIIWDNDEPTSLPPYVEEADET
ncbi:hypothetical protein PTKIN_Ptkin14bG0008100 [Pterospermum kingtungense]